VFVVPYQFEKEDGSIEWRENRFKILDPRESPTGDTVYEASTQAVNFFPRELGRGLGGRKQAARDAAYKHYMKRGRFEDAAIVAEESRKLTIQYRTKIRRSLSALERNIFEVDYIGSVMPTLLAAREHMEERLQIDGEHIADVEHRLDSAVGETGRHPSPTCGIFFETRRRTTSAYLRMSWARTGNSGRSKPDRNFGPSRPKPFRPQGDALITALKLQGGEVVDWVVDNSILSFYLCTSPSRRILADLG